MGLAGCSCLGTAELCWLTGAEARGARRRRGACVAEAAVWAAALARGVGVGLHVGKGSGSQV